jgi:hypothetical protein
MPSIVRRLIAPIVLRFKGTDSLLAAMDMLERSHNNPKSPVSKAELESAMIIIARELIRRKVIFWA